MPIFDKFQDHQNGLTGPICGGFDITPNYANDLAQTTRGVMVSSVGDMAVVLKDGDAITLPGLTPGVIYPIWIAKVLATGATAAGIKGLI